MSFYYVIHDVHTLIPSVINQQMLLAECSRLQLSNTYIFMITPCVIIINHYINQLMHSLV